jgi:hypothetical protein
MEMFYRTICSCKSFNFPCGSKHDFNFLKEKKHGTKFAGA